MLAGSILLKDVASKANTGEATGMMPDAYSFLSLL